MSVYKKLFEAKKEIGKISKDSNNPFYKSKYFDINQLLEHVEPILQKHDLLLVQPILNNKVYSIIYDITDNSLIESYLELTNITDPQKRGSEITYYRRYTLASLLGMQAEDDDANATVKNTSQSNEDTRAWLDQKGFDYLMEKGTPEEIETAFKTRRMKKEYATALKSK
jgi:hypothetical protein